MDREQRKKLRKLMIDKDISGGDIARTVNCTRGNVWHVVAGRQVSPHIRQAIADALGVQVSDLWADEKPRKKAA